MAEDGSLHAPKNKWKMPLFVFFKDARPVFKLDVLGKEILRIAIPAALAVAADPVASLINTAFIGHLGPVELAAAGVSVALFNQASRITIFPLVSITTSFVAEEDTIVRTSITEVEKQFTENSKAKEVKPEVDMLQDIEKGASKENSEISEKSPSENNETEDHMPRSFAHENAQKDATASKENSEISEKSPSENNETDDHMPRCLAHENVEKDATVKNDTNSEADANTIICKSVSFATTCASKEIGRKKQHIASASTALLFGTILGLLQAATLIFAAKPLLGAMGLKPDSPMLVPAQKYLRLRSLGAPAAILSSTMQGIFGGFKDTKTPLYVIVGGYGINAILDPLLIFSCKLGLRGAAIAHVLSQYMMALTLLLILIRKVDLLPPSIKDLHISRFLKDGGQLLLGVIAVTFCVTFAASLAARLGSVPMAAFQACMQVWFTSSILADGLAVAVQTILASAFAEKAYDKAAVVAVRAVQICFFTGVGLSILVGVGLYFGAGIFSKNVEVIHLIRIGLPFLAATQPIHSLAFVFEGVNYGASDFAYTAYSLIMVSIATVATEFLLYRRKQFIGIWIALTIYMTLRMVAGVWRMGTGIGHWQFLKGCFMP